MVNFSFVNALIGGVLIGVSATLLLLFNGRIAGISGIVSGALGFRAGSLWRWLFIVGLLAGGWLYEIVLAQQPTPVSAFAPISMVIGGFLVGVGTRLGHGCTSGHGVCGMSRLSPRSLLATITFIVSGMITVAVANTLGWGW